MLDQESNALSVWQLIDVSDSETVLNLLLDHIIDITSRKSTLHIE
jgi:hypothetical protein